ncbi:MAG: SDR family NAD(P)-dependent oxidoreductase [Leptolyngbya sp.]|nr:SDR family NAD(P)-dependent oxidoreductase [Candidatus Melainabacteria bacterium]
MNTSENYSENKKVWFITGVSRGLGKSLAQEALSRGEIVIGTTRNGESSIADKSDNLHILKLDVVLKDEVKDVVAKAHSIYGRLDVVVNNAGYGLLGAIEESSVVEAYDLFDVNFFGTLHVIQAVLPFLREQGNGHIINVSSVAGLAPMGGYGLYAASKFAVNGMTISLAEELKPLGIKVSIVEPGAFRTDFLSDTSIKYAENKIEAYESTSGAFVARLNKIAGTQLGNPELAAKAMVDLAHLSNPPMHLLLGSDAVDRTRAMLEKFNAEIDQWESVSRSTDFTEAAVAK